MTLKQIEEQISSIATLILLWDGSDKVGVEAILGLVQEIANAGDSVPAQITGSAKWLISQQDSFSSEQAVQYANQFVTATGGFLNQSQTTEFPGSKPSETKNESLIGLELGPNYDSEFVPEFIERHSLMMDELEGEVTAFRFKSNPSEDEVNSFSTFVKKYLHNVKGDAGSIGLIGIERVTHELEDIIQSQGVSGVCEQLIYYREWVKSCVDVLLGKVKAAEPSEKVISRLHELSSGESNKCTEAVPAANQVTSTTHAVTEDAKEYKMTSEAELFYEFAAEASDHLQSIEEILLTKPDNLSNSDTDTVFRCVHSLKGASSYFNLEEINKSSHVLENLLDQVRSGNRYLDVGLRSLIFSYIDLQKELISKAKAVASGSRALKWGQDSLSYMFDVEAYQRGEGVPSTKVKTILQEEVPASPVEAQSVSSLPKAVQSQKATSSPSPQKETSAEALNVKTFVKVDTTRLDLLIDSIGEMVIYSSMLIRRCRELLGDHESVIKTTHQVEKFSRGLQDIGMSMRLDPIKGLFQKMSRLVWDVSKKLNKEVNFVMHGEDTEVDRNVIEKLADPLMHMVRNAIDHGIETPDERVKAGKSRSGTITLSAAHAGGSIHIEIIDDGRGLDAAKLTRKAIEKGLLPQGTVLPPEEAYLLIFAAGFSTAASVTDISGRGVGMDVVRNNIESMRGTIRIESELGKGTTFRIELPLTLAIMDGIETIVGSERLIIPTLAVLEFMKPEERLITKTIGKGETYFFRGSYLPLFRLADLFGIERDASASGLVIVIESGTEQVALMVDGMVGTCQTVIKSLGKMFDEARGFAGCAIMPNGNIGLIVDVRSLIQLARAEYISSPSPVLKFNEQNCGASVH